MPAMHLQRRELLKATTTSPFTRDFRHLLKFPRYWLTRQSFREPIIKSVRPSDRIKFWNVVPGDKIADLRDPSKKLYEVLSINKLSNKVFLKGTSRSVPGGKMRQSKSIHYSRCQLYLGTENFNTGNGEVLSKNVFALRLGTANKRYDSFRGRYIWDRTVKAMWPKLPNKSPLMETLSKIPWPRPIRAPHPKPHPIYDTLKEAVAERTYWPPTLPTRISASVPEPASEAAYINYLFNPTPKPFDQSRPMEVHLYKELANPHSRAKKQARWQHFQAARDSSREEMIDTECNDLKGRTVREATAEAMYKWRQGLVNDEKALKKARWMTKERVEKIQRGRKATAKKTRRQGERLEDLVLAVAPNQVIPKAKGSMKSTSSSA
ncbi:hypothetical protein FIBSPDRAFT_1050239 [Athelia psychrophila]|uniref:Uncharacterized protein n=1 Tax=Athelia psychrophila TaxID=1759441 RepID=A0A166AXW6_9AGAM|nr:hypothetical protein FIBSPDRAFT_1050239 [Fibularhizoctonia sp. CBS 109695]